MNLRCLTISAVTVSLYEFYNVFDLIMPQPVLLYDLKGSHRYTEITESTHRLQTHSGRLIDEFSLATATGICNRELP